MRKLLLVDVMQPAAAFSPTINPARAAESILESGFRIASRRT